MALQVPAAAQTVLVAARQIRETNRRNAAANSESAKQALVDSVAATILAHFSPLSTTARQQRQEIRLAVSLNPVRKEVLDFYAAEFEVDASSDGMRITMQVRNP